MKKIIIILFATIFMQTIDSAQFAPSLSGGSCGNSCYETFPGLFGHHIVQKPSYLPHLLTNYTNEKSYYDRKIELVENKIKLRCGNNTYNNLVSNICY